MVNWKAKRTFAGPEIRSVLDCQSKPNLIGEDRVMSPILCGAWQGRNRRNLSRDSYLNTQRPCADTHHRRGPLRRVYGRVGVGEHFDDAFFSMGSDLVPFNAVSVDLEECFQIPYFDDPIDRRRWDESLYVS